MTADWRDINLANWESRVPVHTGPGGYDLTRFDDPDYLSPVVRYDLPRLGRLDGLDVVHLQCHIGTDTVSLGRLGSRWSVWTFRRPLCKPHVNLPNELEPK